MTSAGRMYNLAENGGLTARDLIGLGLTDSDITDWVIMEMDLKRMDMMYKGRLCYGLLLWLIRINNYVEVSFTHMYQSLMVFGKATMASL